MFVLATAAHAQGTSQFADLIKNPPPDQKGAMTLLVTVFPSAVDTYPRTFVMYLKSVRPKEVPEGVNRSRNGRCLFPDSGARQMSTSTQGHEYRGYLLKRGSESCPGNQPGLEGSMGLRDSE